MEEEELGIKGMIEKLLFSKNEELERLGLKIFEEKIHLFSKSELSNIRTVIKKNEKSRNKKLNLLFGDGPETFVDLKTLNRLINYRLKHS